MRREEREGRDGEGEVKVNLLDGQVFHPVLWVLVVLGDPDRAKQVQVELCTHCIYVCVCVCISVCILAPGPSSPMGPSGPGYPFGPGSPGSPGRPGLPGNPGLP